MKSNKKGISNFWIGMIIAVIAIVIGLLLTGTFGDKITLALAKLGSFSYG